MHAPPPAGRTGRAPPGVDGDGGAGATLDDAAVAVGPAVAPAGDHPVAKASKAAPPHNAAVALVLALLTMDNRSFSSSDSQKRAPAPKTFHSSSSGFPLSTPCRRWDR